MLNIRLALSRRPSPLQCISQFNVKTLNCKQKTGSYQSLVTHSLYCKSQRQRQRQRFFESHQIRFFTTQNLAEIPKIQTYIEHSTYKMTLFLPYANELCTFPLKLNETVRDLINDIRDEEPRIKQIVLHYMDGLRVSHSTTIEVLLKFEFVFTIDDIKYHVLPPQEKVMKGTTENVLCVADLQNLMHKAYYHKIMRRLQSDPRHHIPYNDYLEWCREFGLSDDEALKLSQNLHEVGVILHFSRNSELRDFIFLRPQLVLSTLANTLQLRYIKKGDEEKLKELEDIKKELVPLNMFKEFYDKIAELYATRVLALIGIYLAIQFSVLARMVWIDFNWDIMEPVTYFVTLGTLIFGFAFFTLTKSDYTYPALKERIVKRKLRALYLKNRFNWKRWNSLYQRYGLLSSC
jgi:hypothetical protein